MIKAIIFDVGGVLHASAHLDIVKDISKTLSINEVKAMAVYKELIPLLVSGQIEEDLFWEKFIKKTKTKNLLPEISLFIRTFTDNFQINIEVFKIVEKLKRNKYKLAILSNTIPAHTEYNHKRKIYQLFDVVIFSHEVKLSKPDSKIYKLTLSRLNVRPDEAVFIDDLEENIRTAEVLGIKGILFKNAKQLESALRLISIKL